MTKLSIKFKKPCFWPIFPIFGAKKMFLENWTQLCRTSYGFLAPCQNLEKVNDTIQRKCPDRWKDGRTERPYFMGPFRLLPGSKNMLVCCHPTGSTRNRQVKKIFFDAQSWEKNFSITNILS